LHISTPLNRVDILSAIRKQGGATAPPFIGERLMKTYDKRKYAAPRRALRVNEFCEAYRVSRSTAYRLIAEGKLKTVKVGNRRLVPVDAAEALLESKEG
jgi:excisionase family DNA binding protein